MKHKNQMAKALYDNVPESPEELAFRKGDILTVIEQNTGGLEGWWLCSLHGRQGIAPGNRLKLLIGPMFEGQTVSTTSSSPSPSLTDQQQRPFTPQGMFMPNSAGQAQGIYQVPPSQDVYQVPQRSTLAMDGKPCKVLTPTRVGQGYIYSPSPNSSQDLYDVPPIRTEGLYDIPAGNKTGKYGSPRGQGLYDIPPSQDTKNQGIYDTPPPSQGVYSIPPSRSGTAQDESDYDVPKAHTQKSEGIYDVPPTILNKGVHSKYDFPPSDGINALYDVPVSQLSTGAAHDLYDIPRGKQQQQQQQKQCRERERNKGIYDIPPAESRLLPEVTDGINRLSFSSTGSSMSTSSSSAGSPADGRLGLDLDSALQKLQLLLQGLESSVLSLQSLFSSPNWKMNGFLDSHANDVRATMEHVRGSLLDFLTFGKGTATNATALSDSALHSKLRRHLQRLEDSQQLLQLALENGSLTLAGSKQLGKNDELERFVMVARTLPDDAKQLASTIRSNAEMLFRRAPIEGIVHPFTCTTKNDNSGGQTKPFPVVQDQVQCVKSWMEDYDYVHLQGKDEFERQQKELLEKENITKQNRVQLGQEQLNQFKQLEQEVIKPVENDITKWISHQHSTGSSSPSDSSSTSSAGGGSHSYGRDRQLLIFYGEQCEQHFVTLLNAVDAFFGCVAAGQPPRIFIAHAKFVILSAHKLVFIGDTLSRQVAVPDVANRVMDLSNVLCDMLKTVVSATKIAAQHYPNTKAVQEMVDRVTDLSHYAQQFKMQILHMATL